MTGASTEAAARPAGRFVLGTRGSPLALAQARELAARLAAVHGWDTGELPLAVIRTTGDAIQDRSLSEAGGKGLFTKEIDQAQLDGRIDFAVHSAKDLPTVLPDGIAIAGYLPREDARDVLIARAARSLAELPQGAVVGSASLRRQALLKRARPDLRMVLLRGNVARRLDKIAQGELDATLLALAGLRRLGLADRASCVLGLDECLPAVGQGAIAVAIRAGDAAAAQALAPVLCATTGSALAAERAFLAVLDGSCRTPIAGHATVSAGRLHLRGILLSPDGRESVAGERTGPEAEAAALGSDLGHALRREAPPGLIPGGA